MSKQYDEYLEKHRRSVLESFEWLKNNKDRVFTGSLKSFNDDVIFEAAEYNCKHHDHSKNDSSEYDAYDNWWYVRKNNRSGVVKSEYDLAWLNHIHNNKHHWQHWVLVSDENRKNEALPMPKEYILELICDWWSFSWDEILTKPRELKKWYKEHVNNMDLHPKTKFYITEIIDVITMHLINDVESFERMSLYEN